MTLKVLCKVSDSPLEVRIPDSRPTDLDLSFLVEYLERELLVIVLKTPRTASQTHYPCKSEEMRGGCQQ